VSFGLRAPYCLLSRRSVGARGNISGRVGNYVRTGIMDGGLFVLLRANQHNARVATNSSFVAGWLVGWSDCELRAVDVAGKLVGMSEE
jgi:hypothetical protein